MPDTDALLNGTVFNDDGHGFAIVDRVGGRIIVDRGMDAKDMIRTFVLQRRHYPEGPALFHSRLATDGGINLLNTHPFTIGGDTRTVLAHNGIMPVRPAKGDPRSDTRIVAEDFIPRAFGTLRRRRARLAFQRWLTPANKVVILTVDPRFRDNAFVLNEHAGTWEDGVWYSNDAYLGWYPSTTAYRWDAGAGSLVPTYMGKTSDTYLTCWVCKGDVSVSLGECPFCGLCFDCGEMPMECT
ncbi:MAG TPA: class II glutamine amidotransferase [Gemmatimonadales bacterium]|nr:class II glutamine amidotransferase [Gemmatimonadales bacterium]